MALVSQPIALNEGHAARTGHTSRVADRVDLDAFRVPEAPPDPGLTRHQVTNTVVTWYLILLSAVIATPIYLLIAKGITADDAQKIVVGLSSALTGLAGTLGLVIAFYFKDSERASETLPATRSTPRQTRKSPASSLKSTGSRGAPASGA